MLLIALFPILAALLFSGHYFSQQRQQKMLFQTAENMVQTHPQQWAFVAHYQFTPEYIQQTAKYLNLLNQIDTSFRNISVLVPDQIDGNRVYLNFDEHSWQQNSQQKPDKPLEKHDFIKRLNHAERQYLDQLFAQQQTQTYFSKDGSHSTPIM